MNTRTYLIVLSLLVLAAGAIGCVRDAEGDSQAATDQRDVTSDVHYPHDGSHLIEGSHVTVDPRVLEDLEQSEWVSVHIEIDLPPGYELPSFELYESDPDAAEEIASAWDMELYDQLMAERRANVVSALGPDLEQRPHAGDFITVSGLEKLRNHPYVVAVIWPFEGSLL